MNEHATYVRTALLAVHARRLVDGCVCVSFLDHKQETCHVIERAVCHRRSMHVCLLQLVSHANILLNFADRPC